MSVLPGSVVAAHLRASAAGLADGTKPRPAGECIASPDELASVISDLVAGQQHISASLAQLAAFVRRERVSGILDTVPAEDVLALADVLRAAARAAKYSAEALAESRPMLQVVQDVTNGDTQM
jgi:hypothetical protein